MKMSGVDWEKYFPIMHERHDWMMEQPHEDVWITSHDGLKLHGTYSRETAETRLSSASTDIPAREPMITEAFPGIT